MPPNQIVWPKDNLTSNLIITIKYRGIKATQFFSKYTTESYQELLNDLTELGFPHPKKGNIVFKSHGTLEFFWTIEPQEKSPFVRNLTRRVTLPQEGEFRVEQLAQRKQLSIVSMTVREDMDYDPYLEQTAPFPTPRRVTERMQPAQNQPQNHQSQPQPTVERFHPYSRPPGQPAAKTSSSAVNRVPQSSQGLPIKPTSSNRRAAEVFLDEMETSLGPPLRIKPEPVELTIPPPAPAPPRAPMAQRRASRAQIQIPPSEVQLKKEQISPRFSFTKPQQNHAKTWSYVDLTGEVVQPADNAQSPFLTFPTPRINGNHDHTTSPEIPGMMYSQRTPLKSTHLDRPRIPSQPQTPVNSPAFTMRVPPPSPADVSNGQERPVFMSTPKAEDLPTIQHLTRELFEMRNNLRTGVEKQNLIVEELRRLNAAYVPSKLSLSSTSEYMGDEAARAQLDELEKELESRIARESEFIKELAAERTRRLEMEYIVEDIQREQKAPFVVPALLEAFVKISQASTAAIQYKPSSNSNK